MTLTIALPPEMETQLQAEATRKGLDAETFVLHTLEERLRQSPLSSPTHLSQAEGDLLRRINEGLPPETWQHYHELIAKRNAETLSPNEHTALIALSDQIEQMNVRRLRHLVELARLRHTSLEALMKELGIHAPTHV